ncbi:uncharacterized aarF domain-containing protein kinase 5 isoform X2 [Aethina tumida]|nr:uncharacterized aarF domain-containing protein kinase 5 isoform X2 [Aethina tumida]
MVRSRLFGSLRRSTFFKNFNGKNCRLALLGTGCFSTFAFVTIVHSKNSPNTDKQCTPDKCEQEVLNASNFTVDSAIRFMRSIKIGFSVSLDYYFSELGLTENTPNYNIMMSRIHQRAANKILEGCLLNGGSYIKLGQGLCSMSHILPPEYVNTLKSLQDKCLMRKENELNQIFEKDFGKLPNEIFKEFDTTPIAAASIAQVFKAKTKDDETVAVKVQYIDLQERFEGDVATINFLLKVAGTLHPSFNFDWVLEDLKACLQQELDFVNEGKNSERCAKELQQLKYVYVPKVNWELTSRRVLVTEFIEGHKICDVAKIKQDGLSLADINTKLFEAFGHQIFQTGFVHADPHPGNILIRKVNGKAQLVLLDHGLYQEISAKDREALSYMWKAIVYKEYDNMKKYANQLGVTDHIIFAEILTQAPLRTRGFNLNYRLTEHDLQQMTQFAKERFEVIMKCLKEMPRSLLLVIRNLNTIRAIAQDHGNPIDRYTVLARVATKCIFSKQDTFFKRLSNMIGRLYFELMLLINKISTWFTEIMIKLVDKSGAVEDLQREFSSINTL